jgi:hypothetical protein
MVRTNGLNELRGWHADRVYAAYPSHGRVDPRRRCDFPGCITQLSRYNPSDSCYVHAEPRIFTTRVDAWKKGWG